MQPEWRKLEAALAELNQLARATLSRAEFASKFIHIVTSSIDAQGALFWSHDGNQLKLLASVQLAASSISSELAEATLTSGDAQRIERSNETILLESYQTDHGMRGIIEVHLTPVIANALGETGVMFIASAAQIANEYERNLALRDAQGRIDHQQQLLELAKQLQATNSLGELAYVVTNEVRKLVTAERVLLFEWDQQQAKLLAVSGVEKFETRSAALRAWQDLAQRLGPIREAYWLSKLPDELPYEVEQAIAEVRETNHVSEFGFLPLVAKLEEQEILVGHLVCEWFTQPASDRATTHASEAAELIGPLMLREAMRTVIPFRSLSDWWAKRRWVTTPITQVQRLIQIGLASLLLSGLAMIPVPFNIEATGELLPSERQHIFAPADGIVHEITRKEGDYRQDELILSLENKTWQLELDEIRGKHAIAVQELRTAETERLQQTEGASQPVEGTQLSARIEQLKAKQYELETQLQILVNRQTELEVIAPWSGTIITWDWQRQLAGRPVKRGELLCTLANLQGDWQVEIRIPATEAYYITEASKNSEEALRVTFRLGHDPGQTYTGFLQKLSPAIETAANQPPVMIGTVTAISPTLRNPRPGASGKASIACGRRSLGFVWLRPLIELMREYGW